MNDNKSVSYLTCINTSVDDCKVTLECELRRNPQSALCAATSALEELNSRGQPSHTSRKKALQTIINKANKLLLSRMELQS
ncbi:MULTISPECIES: hypothetical protein [unclassified Shewanella]|uniref:hypothetical protein n=1 Tax=unclassified Shewanella TaxID=196818 RepID=UPI0022BA330F|nr:MULTISPECIES: hypothetical protein [unclassified Shewanella]MEC4740957.1 hypothetical protein [Shewanella sp. E94]WBJ93545.1 hypothetical protein HWQ47_16615 [Shewanella sp. MTB7]